MKTSQTERSNVFCALLASNNLKAQRRHSQLSELARSNIDKLRSKEKLVTLPSTMSRPVVKGPIGQDSKLSKLIFRFSDPDDNLCFLNPKATHRSKSGTEKGKIDDIIGRTFKLAVLSPKERDHPQRGKNALIDILSRMRSPHNFGDLPNAKAKHFTVKAVEKTSKNLSINKSVTILKRASVTQIHNSPPPTSKENILTLSPPIKIVKRKSKDKPIHFLKLGLKANPPLSGKVVNEFDFMETIKRLLKNKLTCETYVGYYFTVKYQRKDAKENSIEEFIERLNYDLEFDRKFKLL